MNEDGYMISVEGFSDWIEALEEIEVAKMKTRLTKLVESASLKSLLNSRTYPTWFSRSADIVIFALLASYPNGITKEKLVDLANVKESSMNTLLTSKEKGIADHLIKNDAEEYMIQSSSIIWAINTLTEQKTKSQKQ